MAERQWALEQQQLQQQQVAYMQQMGYSPAQIQQAMAQQQMYAQMQRQYAQMQGQAGGMARQAAAPRAEDAVFGALATEFAGRKVGTATTATHLASFDDYYKSAAAPPPAAPPPAKPAAPPTPTPEVPKGPRGVAELGALDEGLFGAMEDAPPPSLAPGNDEGDTFGDFSDAAPPPPTTAAPQAPAPPPDSAFGAFGAAPPPPHQPQKPHGISELGALDAGQFGAVEDAPAPTLAASGGDDDGFGDFGDAAPAPAAPPPPPAALDAGLFGAVEDAPAPTLAASGGDFGDVSAVPPSSSIPHTQLQLEDADGIGARQLTLHSEPRLEPARSSEGNLADLLDALEAPMPGAPPVRWESPKRVDLGSACAKLLEEGAALLASAVSSGCVDALLTRAEARAYFGRHLPLVHAASSLQPASEMQRRCDAAWRTLAATCATASEALGVSADLAALTTDSIGALARAIEGAAPVQ